MRTSARDRARYAARTYELEALTDESPADSETVVVLTTCHDTPLVATDHTADLLAALTQEDIDYQTPAWERAVEIEKERIIAALAAEVPVLGEDPTPEEIARLAEAVDRCYDEHEVSLLAAAPLPDTETVNGRAALAAVYGTPDRAVVAVGEAIARRAERHAGIRGDEVRERWAARVFEVRTELEPLWQAIEAAKNDPTPAGRDRLKALREQARPLRDRLEALRLGTDPATLADLSRLADGYRTALAEVRDMGGDLSLHEKSSKPSAKVLAEAAQIYPSDWLDASNSGHALPLYVGTKATRGSYQDTSRIKTTTTGQAYDYTVPKDRTSVPAPELLLRRRNGRLVSVYYTYEPVDADQVRSEGYRVPEGVTVYKRLEWETMRAPAAHGPGPQWERVDGHGNSQGELWVRPRVTRSARAGEDKVAEIRLSSSVHVLPGRADTYSAAVHELGHRMQQTVPRLAEMERDWRERRTTGQDGTREQKVRIYARTGEVGWRDEFAVAYAGRDYGPGEPYTEVLTVGVESLFGGENGGLVGAAGYERDPVTHPQGKADDDFRAFVLGAMASAGRRR